MTNILKRFIFILSNFFMTYLLIIVPSSHTTIPGQSFQRDTLLFLLIWNCRVHCTSFIICTVDIKFKRLHVPVNLAVLDQSQSLF